MCNNSVLEIAGLRFVFLINQDLIEAIRHESYKQMMLTTNLAAPARAATTT